MKSLQYILLIALCLFGQQLKGQTCINHALIDSNHTCPTVIQFVCGCDGITYKNSCEAEHYGGVTNWTPGQCNTSGGCQANFTFTVSSASGNQVSFSNTSFGNFNSVQWNFGDGNFSVQNNPTHTYQNAGTYTVCLSINTNTPNCNDTVCKTFTLQNTGPNCIDTNLINLLSPCQTIYDPVCGCNGLTYPNSCEAKYRAGVTHWTQGACHNSRSCNATFNYTVFVGVAGYTVLFNNTSTGDYDFASWNFGDGSTSSDENPNHTYFANTFPNVVEVCLMISDSAQHCNDSYCQFINLAPIGCFDAAAISSNFICPTVITPVCGCDGNTYNNACEAYNHHGITSWTNGPCMATSGCRAEFRVRSQGLNFHFDNTSSGQFSSCSWDFGDGDTSKDCSPNHSFLQPGRYLVCLEIFDPHQNCRDTFCLPIVISTPNQFCQDSSMISSAPCPTVYEPVCGCNGITYSHECVASHYAGISSWTHGPCSSSSVVSCRAFFNFSTIASPIGYEVYFSNQSVGSINLTKWGFGDGTISQQQHPSHTYLVPGYYLVCLTVEDTLRNCSDTYCANIRVNAGNGCIDLTVVDSLVSCPQIIDPVCGCDGKTYVNSCEAYFMNGVTYWTKGTCTNGGCQAGYNFEIDGSGRGARFNNTSIGNFSRSFWDFGDGNNSDELHPFHLYNVTAPEVFTTCLSIFDSVSNCTDSYCRNISVSKLDHTGFFSANERSFDFKVFPNPFSLQTSIEFELREPAFVKVEMFTIIGKRVKLLDEQYELAGKHYLIWNSDGVSSGVYFLTLTVNGEKYNHRLHVIR